MEQTLNAAKAKAKIKAAKIPNTTTQIVRERLAEKGIKISRQAIARWLNTPGASSKYEVELIAEYLLVIHERFTLQGQNKKQTEITIAAAKRLVALN